MEDVKHNFINSIASARKWRGMTQAELARRVGTQPSNISRLETGKANPSLDFLMRIAEALDLYPVFKLAAPGMLAEPEWKQPFYSTESDDIYEIRNFDKPIVTFRFERDTLGEMQTKFLFSVSVDKNVFPLDLETTDEGIYKWLKGRMIPKNRTFVEEILESLGLSENDTKGIIDICLGLSLNDSFWVVPTDFKGLYADYNLYENNFSEALSLVAFTGVGITGVKKKLTTSPELTTNGMLPKAWRMIENDGIYLYKGGTSGFANTGMEPYSEYYASQIAEAMGLDAIRYGLEKWDGILASKCRLFTDIDTSYVPIGRIVKTGGLVACMKWLEDIDVNFAEAMRSMLVFDALIYNEDRHFGNFGILRDNYCGDILALAPLFDHGLSLFNFAMKDDFDDLDKYAKTRYPAYRDTNFEKICEGALGPQQRAQLRKIFNFSFTPHEHYNWEDYRLKAIEEHIRSRARDLVNL